MRKGLLYMVLVYVVLAACSRNETYWQYRSLFNEAWHQDSCLLFLVEVTDLSTPQNLELHIRHQSIYPYKNLWLFIETTLPSGESKRDTVECTLANDYGKWYGKGLSVLEQSFVLENRLVFKQKGEYRYRVQHAMRDSLLSGLSEVGLKLTNAQPY